MSMLSNACFVKRPERGVWSFLLLCFIALPGWAQDAAVAELEARVARLTQELESAQSELAAARAKAAASERELAAVKAPIQLGPVTVGGAVRVNYVHGDYTVNGKAPQRGGNGGNVELDTARINLALNYGPVIGKFEYRWYDGYNFLHTGWLGYDFGEEGQVQLGVTRVPFGAGPYGVSQSWFFDQHYYVGLADDMDLGIKYVRDWQDWSFDLAYFYSSERDWKGASQDSARYSYDIVKWRSTINSEGDVASGPVNGYKERNQFNARAIYHLKQDVLQADIGLSLQYGELDGTRADDGHHWAASAHMVSYVGNFVIGTQLSRYEVDVGSDNLLGTDDLVPMGAYDFAWPVATKAWLPAVSVGYKYQTAALPWLAYVMPYVEYSGILKNNDNSNDSEMITLGAAWSHGPWYIYTDYVWSNGNYFIGNEGDDYSNIYHGVGDFGADGNDRWNTRLNLNFGYYF